MDMKMDEGAYKRFSLTLEGREYRDGDLPERYRRLVDEAREAARGAYCPYSGFAVGAAALLEDGTVVRGANQENVAYPSGMCAERTVLFHAGAVRPGVKVVALAVVGRGKDGGAPVLASPCGACRQVMAEVAGRQRADFEVVLPGGGRTLVVWAKALLPLAFGF